MPKLTKTQLTLYKFMLQIMEEQPWGYDRWLEEGGDPINIEELRQLIKENE